MLPELLPVHVPREVPHVHALLLLRRVERAAPLAPARRVPVVVPGLAVLCLLYVGVEGPGSSIDESISFPPPPSTQRSTKTTHTPTRTSRMKIWRPSRSELLSVRMALRACAAVLNSTRPQPLDRPCASCSTSARVTVSSCWVMVCRTGGVFASQIPCVRGIIWVRPRNTGISPPFFPPGPDGTG